MLLLMDQILKDKIQDLLLILETLLEEATFMKLKSLGGLERSLCCPKTLPIKTTPKEVMIRGISKVITSLLMLTGKSRG